MEQIKAKEAELQTAHVREAEAIEEELRELRKRLLSANKALNEGSQVLKG